MNPDVENALPEQDAAPRRWTRWFARQPQDYYLTRWLFLRLLALVYLVAFLSYWVQMEGLIGHNGILPADGMAGRMAELLGAQRFWRLPSLFWLYPHDLTLHLLCGGGVLAALALLAGFLPPLCLPLLWAFYLSLVSVSQDFLGFQWDSLLLEVGFMSVFLGPFQLLPRLSKQAAPSPVVLWLLRWVLFRLMFGSGIVKLGDPTWSTLTALYYHFETQPLPTPVAWYAHQLPGLVLELSVAAMLLVELVAPFFIFGPRRLRLTSFFLFAGLQLLIMITGNFAFFNWLTLTLCVLQLDDRFLRRVLPEKLSQRFQCPSASPVQRAYRRYAAFALASLVVLFGILQLVRLEVRRYRPPSPLGPVVEYLEPLRLVNPYGLFAAMTTMRPEIVIEGSNDGKQWRPYVFKAKPGDLKKSPRWVAPHQPRLDWQLWFAAMGPAYNSPWFQNLMVRLLQGSPEVLSLFRDNPFPQGPPRYVRATLYQYNFSRYGQEEGPDQWWTRQELGPYFPPTSLK